MSIRIMSEVWKLKLPDSPMLLLLALADWANDDGVCWPSISKLADKTNKSERTLQRAIQELVKDGHLTRQENPGKGVLYIVHPRQECHPRQIVTPVTHVTTPPSPVSPNTSYTHHTVVLAKANPTVAKMPKQPKGTRLPDDWQPGNLSGSIVQDLQVMGFEWENRELEKFRDYWKAQTGSKAVKADWNATWRNWIRSAIERSGKNGQRNYNNGSGQAGSPDYETPRMRALRNGASYHKIDF